MLEHLKIYNHNTPTCISPKHSESTLKKTFHDTLSLTLVHKLNETVEKCHAYAYIRNIKFIIHLNKKHS